MLHGSKLRFLDYTLSDCLRNVNTSNDACYCCRILPLSHAYIVKMMIAGAFMKDYIEERAVEIAYYIIENKATVRQTAKKFGVSKSTIHIVVVK